MAHAVPRAGRRKSRIAGRHLFSRTNTCAASRLRAWRCNTAWSKDIRGSSECRLLDTPRPSILNTGITAFGADLDRDLQMYTGASVGGELQREGVCS